MIVLADGSKIGRALNAVVGPADGIETLVTDSSAPAAELEALGRLGIRIVLANPPEPGDPDIEAPAAPGRGRVATRS
jgi:hypothetical protein